MGSYAYTTINNYELTWSKNYFDEWFFHKNDRVRALDEDGEIKFIGYKVDLHTLKIRLELAGYDIEYAKNDFENLQNNWINYLKTIVKDCDYLELKERAQQQLNLLQTLNFEKWLSIIPFLLDKENTKLQDDMTSSELANSLRELIIDFDAGLNSSASSFFPCSDMESFAVILMKTENYCGFCELDLTDLYFGGRIEDFHDIAQVQKQKTYIYETFEKSILDLYEIKKLQINNPIFNNMLLGNAVSAMEAYLFDTFKKLIIEKESIKRRYVENYENFNNKANIKPENLFNFLDKLDEKISNEIDRLSFHNIDLVKGLYKKILCCSIDNNEINELRRIITQRHDIVHRNGKTLSGDQIQITSESLEQYLTCISNFIKNLDYQIINNLLDD